MAKYTFTPTAYLSITNVCTLWIAINQEESETMVQSAYYDEEGKKMSRVTNSILRFDSKGRAYFTKGRQRYYISEFIRKNLFG